MSDADSDADSISDASSAHSDGDGDDDDGDEITVNELCDRLRANDPSLLNSVFKLAVYLYGCSEAQCIAVFQALKENTSVKHIDFSAVFNRRNYTRKFALVAAEYVESSKTLQRLNLSDRQIPEGREMISLVLRALSRNASVTNLTVSTQVVKIASMAFQELLTCTQTLQKLKIMGIEYEAFDELQIVEYEAFDEVQIAAIASGFANNTTLRELTFMSWRQVDLAPVLTALHSHPVLEKIHFQATELYYLPSLSGLEILLQSQDSKVKELVIEQVDNRTAGLHAVLQELRHNTTVTKLAIRQRFLSREDFQQLIADVLRDLIRRNKTISSLCLTGNAFGRNAAATQSISEGLRCNTALQQLDLSGCGLDDRGLSVLANALVARNASMVKLILYNNKITSVGLQALFDDTVEAVKTLNELCLERNPVRSEGVTILADALGRNTMPFLKRLNLCACQIKDDGFVALVSTLEQNTSLHLLGLSGNNFHERGFMALAESLPNIKGLQQITITANASFQSTLPLLLEGFRKNTSLVKVNINLATRMLTWEWFKELKFLGQRNRFTPMLKASDPPDASPQLGIWSRALAKVATELDVLFHVLRNKPKLVGSAASGSKKRKRDNE